MKRFSGVISKIRIAWSQWSGVVTGVLATTPGAIRITIAEMRVAGKPEGLIQEGCVSVTDMRAHTEVLSALRTDSAPVQTGKES